MRHTDVIVIGSGQGGVPLALELSQQGKEVVLFEKDRMGGSCVNWGCTPSKAFLASAHAAGAAAAARRLGIHAEVRVDFRQVMERVRQVRDNFNDGSEKRIQQSDLVLIRAEASFTAQGNVQGGGEVYSAPLVVIDTGSSPGIPPVAGLEGLPYLTDRNFWDLEALPPRTLVLGGGYIGLELSQGLARLGSGVSVIDREAQILSTESFDVGSVLMEALQDDGVQFYLQATAEQIEYRNGNWRLQISGGSSIEGDALLIAAGRVPNTQRLNAPDAGIELDDQGYIKVNDRLETTRPGVYAIGEAARQPAFTHVSWEDHRRILDVLKGGGRTRDDRVLSYAVFTEPQIGRTGLDLESAKKKGFRAREARMEIKDMARAIECGHDKGFYQMVVDENGGRILGATLVGHEAGELVHIIADLIEAGATWQALADAQHIHPTYAENLPSLARMFDNEK
jgi:pyruvate/2-oxoglutarate dehydrogenase complex dihydrolipoamide dehydrogenase (E3) component